MIRDLGEYAALLTQLLLLGTVVYNIIVSRGNRQRITEVAARVEEVHTATNGLTAKLEAASKREGIAIGTAIGVQQEKDANLR